MHPAPTDKDAPDDSASDHRISIRRVSPGYGQGIYCAVGIDILRDLPIRTT
jgi:hypothetical protein